MSVGRKINKDRKNWPKRKLNTGTDANNGPLEILLEISRGFFRPKIFIKRILKKRKGVRKEMSYEDVTPVRMYCNNCARKCIGYLARDQTARFECGCCGTVLVSKKKTKRIIDVRLTAPPNQTLLE